MSLVGRVVVNTGRAKRGEKPVGHVLAWIGSFLLIAWALQAALITWLYRSSLRESDRPFALRKQTP